MVSSVIHRKAKDMRESVIDLDDTDGDSDLEEMDDNEYQADGFVVFGSDDKAGLKMLASSEDDDRAREVMADTMWSRMLTDQLKKWDETGRNKRAKKELEYKLGQFRTDEGKAIARNLITQYQLDI